MLTDVFSKAKRSEVMSKIKGRDTAPELRVRSLLHKMGYRFRLHVADLPGRPDIVLPRHRTVIFVHGCFWHRHEGCKLAYTPKTRTNFWLDKLKGNVIRDANSLRELQGSGWKVIVLWQCEIASMNGILDIIEKELGVSATIESG
jgi:DNA mismatch endonuclease, patch repair protein